MKDKLHKQFFSLVENGFSCYAILPYVRLGLRVSPLLLAAETLLLFPIGLAVAVEGVVWINDAAAFVKSMHFNFPK